jgi:hypothetical protein
MTETVLLTLLIAGFGGGVVRGLVGFIKHQFSYKNVGFKPAYFFGMMFLSGVVGVLTAVAIHDAGITILGIPELTPGLAFIVGYAGGDLIENIYKIIFGKTTLYS